ncbi:hypothetical protein C8Q80DRAFT_1121985 [Daedaleopsis nitida]|nr:hypothetical protein C8Q80DRAFT_1121985 [Daedaleopsis nitida]
MRDLPEELISYIFTFFAHSGVLSNAMLVCQDWYMHGARILHFNVTLNLRPGLSINSSDTIILFMKRLVSPTLSTADCIHHLILSGFASLEIQEVILEILGRTRTLRSLDMHALNIIQGGMLISPDTFTSDEFLPSLIAVNAFSAHFCVSLAHTRRIHALRIHEPLDISLLRCLSRPRDQLAKHIQCLELILSATSTAAAIESMAYLASTLADAPLEALALQFAVDGPGPVSWAQFELALGEMGMYLRSLRNLRSLSLVFRPDPIMSVNADVGPPSNGEEHRETVTKRLAEKLIRENGMDRLRRIEVRWHGWWIEDEQLVPLPRTQLLRLPHLWLFAESDC